MEKEINQKFNEYLPLIKKFIWRYSRHFEKDELLAEAFICHSHFYRIWKLGNSKYPYATVIMFALRSHFMNYFLRNKYTMRLPATVKKSKEFPFHIESYDALIENGYDITTINDFDKNIMLNHINDLLLKQKPKEQDIVKMVLNNYTFAEIGSKYNVSRQRIDQIHKKFIKKLKKLGKY